MSRHKRGFRRTETERQTLIAELRRLRAAGVNVERQGAIAVELRDTFELGWPELPKRPSWTRCAICRAVVSEAAWSEHMADHAARNGAVQA